MLYCTLTTIEHDDNENTFIHFKEKGKDVFIDISNGKRLSHINTATAETATTQKESVAQEQLNNLSDELDENGIPFVKASDGTTTFGEIKDVEGLQDAPIKLSQGYQDEDTKEGYGLKHLEDNHGKQIRNAGFNSVEEFVEYVAKNYDKEHVKEGITYNDGTETFIIQIQDEHANVLFIELSKDGKNWNVNSGGIFRKGYTNNKKNVGVKSELSQSSVMNDNSSLSEQVKQDKHLSEPNNENQPSTNEGTTISDNSKENNEPSVVERAHQIYKDLQPQMEQERAEMLQRHKYLQSKPSLTDEEGKELMDLLKRQLTLENKYRRLAEKQAQAEADNKSTTTTDNVPTTDNTKEEVKDGVVQSFYDNGNGPLWEEKTLVNGKLEGLRRTWHKNGQLAMECSYKNDKLEGLKRIYNQDGSVSSEQYYHNGKKVSKEEYESKYAPKTEEEEVKDEAEGSSFRIAPKSLTPEEQEIISRAKANGTYMKAPNGQPTNLTEKQWVQVRTKAFKDWFGDWEIANKLHLIDKIQPTSLDEEKPLTKKEAEDIVRKLDVGVNKFDGRKVNWVVETIGKICGHQGFEYSLIIPNLKEIYDNSVCIIDEKEEKKEGHKVHTNFTGYHHYLGKVELNGREYYVRFTLQETNTHRKDLIPNQLHSAFVSDIKIYSADSSVNSGIIDPATLETSTTGVLPIKPDTKLQQFLEKAKKLSDNCSKVVDENGEPLVVYHGTPKGGFTIFESLNLHHTEKGDGIWFNDNLDDAQTFTALQDGYVPSDNTVYSCFLNIRTPKVYDFNGRGALQRGKAPLERWLNLGDRYDGLQIKNVKDRHEKSGGFVTDEERDIKWCSSVFVVGSPTQIKSATDNVGTFDNNNPDIRYRQIDGTSLTPNTDAQRRKSEENKPFTDLATQEAEKRGCKVVVHKTLTECPTKDVLQAGGGKLQEGVKPFLDGRIRAWLDPNDNTVHIYAPNCTSAEEALRDVWHEVVAHKGLKDLLGDQFVPTMEAIFKVLPADVQTHYLVYGYNEMGRKQQQAIFGHLAPTHFDEETLTKTQLGALQRSSAVRVKAADEYCAFLSEDEHNKAWYQQVWDILCGAIRTLVRKIDPHINLSDKDIAYLLNRSDKLLLSEKEAKDKFLNTQINVVQAKAHDFKNIKEAEDWAKANIVRVYTNEETGGNGSVSISNHSISKFLSESSVKKSESQDVHLSTLKVLPDVIKNAIEVEQHPDWKKVNGERKPENGIDDPNITMHITYGAVNIGGNDYRVKITLKEDRSNVGLPKKAYNYEVEEIELLAGQTRTPAINTNATRNSNNSTISLANLLKDIKSTNKNEDILDVLFRMVYHGTGALFDKFDLSKMSTGEGCQAYGWGIYLSEVYGIAKGYAERCKNYAREECELKAMIAGLEDLINDTKSSIRLLNDKLKNATDDEDIKDIQESLQLDYEGLKDSTEALDEYRTKYDEFKKSRKSNKYIYTVDITDDDSKFLQYDRPVPYEQKQVIADGLREQGRTATLTRLNKLYDLGDIKTGKDLYAELSYSLDSEQQASEFLHDCGFVGIKYPAEYRSGGRSDGASNYVIFDPSDARIVENVQFRIGNKRKEDMRQGMRNKLTDMSEEEIEQNVKEIERLGEQYKQAGKEGNTKLEACAYKWFLNGSLRLPEDNYKILDALSVAEKKGIDPLKYSSPMELLNANQDTKPALRKTDPDTIKEFSDKKELPHGVVTYEVEDTRAGQAAVRKMIDEHWGEDANPWCLAARINGNLDNAWEYWNHYNSYPKRIAFQDGKLLAFCANQGEVCYWDRTDTPHKGIPIIFKEKYNDNIRTIKCEIDGVTGDLGIIERSAIGDGKNGEYKEWNSNGVLVAQYNLKNGKYDGVQRTWHDNGQLESEYYVLDNKFDGLYRDWYEDGQLYSEQHFRNGKQDGVCRLWYNNGALNEEVHIKNGVRDGVDRYWNVNGILYESYFINGVEVSKEEYEAQRGKVEDDNREYSIKKPFGNQIKDEVERIFDDVIKDKKSNKPIPIGTLTTEGREYLQKLSGLTLKENVSFVLNPSDLVHIYNGHFGKNETDKRNIPLNKEDIRNIVDVITQPDKVIFDVEKEGLQRKMFSFLKDAGNGTYNLLEIYSDNKGNLTAKTFYKTRKGVSQRAITLQENLHSTSETDGATLSDTKIPILFEQPKEFSITDKKDVESSPETLDALQGLFGNIFGANNVHYGAIINKDGVVMGWKQGGSIYLTAEGIFFFTFKKILSRYLYSRFFIYLRKTFQYVFMKRLLLVDAMAFIFRAYFGYNSHHLTNKRGEDTSAIYGFCIFLDELIKKLSPTHIGVAFEGRGDNFRKQHYTEYKAQRPPAPQPIVDAIPIIQSILTARHIPVLQVDGYEADDIIGTLSVKALAGGMDEIYMATPDKDYAQLVNDRVRICKPRKTGGYDILGVEEVCNKYGLTAPKQVIDMLALMGDHSDNIPGCTGIGEKTAIKLLQQFGTIDYMYAHRGDIHGLLEEHVLTQEEQVRFSYYLATIVLDAPIEFSAEQFQRYDPDNKALRAIYADLDFRSFVARIDEKEMQHDLFS